MDAAPSPSPAILVIGYGNDLRGDDAAGVRVAEAVEQLGLENVEVMVRHQLTPELAEPMARARAVIFADAIPRDLAGEVTVTEVAPAADSEWRAHGSNPAALLALTQALYGRVPPAWCVAIPAAQFDYGAPLSPGTAAAVVAAVSLIRKLMAERIPGCA
jgi:hydrogenase maturation protease